jgi:hypothetical protein
MPIATGLALGLGIAGAVGGATIGAVGANKAAGTQARAAMSAEQLQAQQAQDALDFQKQQYADQQKNQLPFLQAGQGAITKLSDLVNNGGFPAWNQTFQAPTADQARQTPGYQFAQQQGQQAIQNSAAARGGLLSGNTATDLEKYSQGLADTNYQNVYNNALQSYQQNYNQYQQNQANQFNRYASLAGVGQQSANTLGQQGQQAAGNVANISLQSGAQQGADINNAAAARASGYVGATNAVTGGINNLSQLLMLQQAGLFSPKTPSPVDYGAYTGL